ncbi:MAG TPA: hypothetical protein VF474_03220 [Phenylobacterium sp.]
MAPPSSSMEEGRDGGVRTGEEAKVEVGADLILRRHLSGHTTTQPSSIEEEGS